MLPEQSEVSIVVTGHKQANVKDISRKNLGYVVIHQETS